MLGAEDTKPNASILVLKRGSLPAARTGRAAGPRRGAAPEASTPPSHLRAHHWSAEPGWAIPRRGRVPAPPGASDLGQTYKRKQNSLSPCGFKNRALLARVREGREPGKTARRCGGVEKNGGLERGGKREERVGGPNAPTACAAHARLGPAGMGGAGSPGSRSKSRR